MTETMTVTVYEPVDVEATRLQLTGSRVNAQIAVVWHDDRGRRHFGWVASFRVVESWPRLDERTA